MKPIVITLPATVVVGNACPLASKYVGSNVNVCATGTITSNGVTWTGNFGFLGTSQTYTLADDFTVNGTITCNVTTLGTLNGFTIYAKSSWSHTGANLLGTTNLVFNGTGTWNHTTGNYVGLNTTINTSGTITFGVNGECSNIVCKINTSTS